MFVAPEDATNKNWLRIPLIKRGDERSGDLVHARVIKHPFQEGAGHAEVISVIANDRDPQLLWKLACARQGLPMEAPSFNPQQCISQGEADNQSAHADLTHLPFVTIDGEYTRDIDDALFARIDEASQLKLWVAIADPDRYIEPGNEMDLDALERGFTAYIPGLNLPMLHRAVSEQGASLMLGQTRSVVVCEMVVGERGELMSPRIYMGCMRSHAKLSYGEVMRYMAGTRDDCPAEVHANLDALEMAMRRLERQQIESLSDDQANHRLIIEDNRLVDIETVHTYASQRLVELCMVAANTCFARFMRERNIGCVYRRHDGFAPVKLQKLADILCAHGLSFTAEVLATAEGFEGVRQQLAGRADPVLEMLIRRFYGRTRHDVEPGPHQAMGVDCYATFTSPLRKYSDLINHRSLKRYLCQEAPLALGSLIAEHLDKQLSATSRAAREVRHGLYAGFYLDKVGQTMAARVTRLLRSGALGELETGAQVFISSRGLGKRDASLTLNDQSTELLKEGEVVLRLGETVSVTIEWVDPETRNIGVVLSETTAKV
jgi:exoribonuclease-2